MFFVGIAKHISQIFLEFQTQQETSRNFLNTDDLLAALVEVDFDEVSWAIAPVETLDQDTWTIALEYSPEAIDIDLEVK